MKLLTRKENLELYMQTNSENPWTDPVLIIKDGSNEEVMTVSSGELELPFGEFIINENFVDNSDNVSLILNEIADEDTIENISQRRKKFTLKKEYLEKAKEMYHSK